MRLCPALIGAIAFGAWLDASAVSAKPAIRGPFVFDCVGETAERLTVTYLGAKASRARLAYKGETVIARHAVSADGALYTAKNVEFWNKGDDAVVEWRGVKLKCALGD